MSIGLIIEICPFGLTSVHGDVRGQLQYWQDSCLSYRHKQNYFLQSLYQLTRGLYKGAGYGMRHYKNCNVENVIMHYQLMEISLSLCHSKFKCVISQFTSLLVMDAGKDPISAEGWVMVLVTHPNSSIMR